ncbi:hypothetical protein J6590_014928 [Homalodisca vitripennis]|nr:hypothetical protein J6590_014928 [Homalodisca vitripennis]
MRLECVTGPQFPCQYCEKRFNRNSSLNRHLIMVHKLSGQRLKRGRPSKIFSEHELIVAACFPCQLCGAKYSLKRNLWRHRKFECGQEPRFQCSFCSSRFKHKFNLNTHIANRHMHVGLPTDMVHL